MSDHAALQRRLDALEARAERAERRATVLELAIVELIPPCDGAQDCVHCNVQAELDQLRYLEDQEP